MTTAIDAVAQGGIPPCGASPVDLWDHSLARLCGATVHLALICALKKYGKLRRLFRQARQPQSFGVFNYIGWPKRAKFLSEIR